MAVVYHNSRVGAAAPFVRGEPKAAPFRKDSAGNVVVWRRDVGKGRIVTVACDRMLPDAYARCSHGDYKKRLMEAVSPGFRTVVSSP